MQIKHSETLKKKDDKYIWHAMRPYQPEATMVIEQGEGAWITDIEGNRYLDGMSGLWCVNVGYGREELAQAAYEQLKQLSYYPMTHSHVSAIRLAEKLNEWLGGQDEYVFFFSNSGSEANETAFKIARQYHKQRGEHDRYKFVARYRAYHGNTMAALAATGQAQRKYRYEPLGTGFLHVTPPDLYRGPGLEAAEELEKVLAWELPETVAAVIMEPIITGGGIIMPPDDYLQAVREICDRYGVLLIIDEVICGFGRTGERFGFMHYGIKPDIISMAKGITSAYIPLSATAVKREIYEAFKGADNYEYFRHVNTFGGHPGACAVAVRNLEIMEEERLVERSRELGERMLNDLKGLEETHPYVGNVRGKGLLVGIELVQDKETKAPLGVEQVNKVIAACKKRGLIITKNGDTVAGYNNVIALAPPLSITDDDYAFIVEVLKEGLAEIG
ncbi:adenosylmethionine-8-amino-7-oxononanoate aminotransferase [Caldalkalibacillus uzonensis]|uniref:Adenosylmethionine-8-amino-7-oxononanoate aminotransferase n=1 Tax=Caldalkalibacillus uzonensis TaxID=353224 RepID=A0ABU0CQJ7_9BACI|nr:aspartate aminotransferase family protein [Caldalkalibacillus uzonensis]MDQ0338681.1 adenosylmethionine-8-amino-7-oxononanoate aminotransferase [Caldalkalibacillus uzonensis]